MPAVHDVRDSLFSRIPSGNMVEEWSATGRLAPYHPGSLGRSQAIQLAIGEE